MHRHPTQRRRQDARNAIAYWLDSKAPAESETSEDIRSSIEIDDDESPSLVRRLALERRRKREPPGRLRAGGMNDKLQGGQVPPIREK